MTRKLRQAIRSDLFVTTFMVVMVCLALVFCLSFWGCGRSLFAGPPEPPNPPQSLVTTTKVKAPAHPRSRLIDMDRDGNVVDEHFVPALQDQLDSERTARASAETGREMAQRKLRSAASAMGWIGGICALASVLTLVGSFFLPILPRAAAGWCLAGALLGWGVQYFLLVYGVYFAEAAVWLSVAACVVMGITVGIPWVIAFKRKMMLKVAKDLESGGHIDAAVAMEAAALPRKFPDSDARKARLRELRSGTAGPDARPTEGGSAS